MEGLKKSFLVRGNNIVGFSDKNFSTCPIGTVLSFAGQTAPHGYLLANGASYKVADYPDLYAVIGNTYGGDTENFNVPDYRETVLVGVGENTTDTIASHDVYELGEFKDDQLQGHEHNTYKNYEYNATGGAGTTTSDGGVARTLDIVPDDTNGEPRVDTTTHGKQKGVTYIIKAFHTNEGVDSGVSDDVIDYVDGEIAKVETDMDKVAKYPDWSNQQKISQTEITVDQDVYIELNQLSSYPIEALKINGKAVSVSDSENGLYSTRFSGYVKKGSFISYPYLTNANIVRVFPLV